jgi:nucleoside-diphosphate-sugar epimerase
MVETETCLVTGGAGFLGRYVVAALQAHGSSVMVMDRDVVPGPGALVVDLTAPPIELPASSFDTVYHLAGLAHFYPRSEQERRRFFEVNLGGLRNLLAALEGGPGGLPESFVLVSTVAVYGLESGDGITEDQPRTASDPYGASKRQAEDLLLDWAQRHGVRAGIVRLPLVAGHRPPGNLGAMITALRRRRYLGIGDGRARRSMVMAGDVARVLTRVAARGGIFHLTDGLHPSFRELEGVLCRALARKRPVRLPLPVARVIARAGDRLTARGMHFPLTTSRLSKMTSNLTFSDQRAREQLAWCPASVVEHAAELVKSRVESRELRVES